MAERRLQALPSQPQAIETRLMRMTMRQGGQGVISWSRWCHLMSGWGGRLCCFGVGVGGVKQHCWFQGGRNGAFGSALNPNLLLIHEEHKKIKKIKNKNHSYLGWCWVMKLEMSVLFFFLGVFCCLFLCLVAKRVGKRTIKVSLLLEFVFPCGRWFVLNFQVCFCFFLWIWWFF